MLHSCERCESPATVHLTEIKGGTKTESHFCADCARALQVPKPGKELQKLIQKFDTVQSAARRRGAEGALRCDACGMTWAEFRQQGRFGCPHDYDAFGEQIVALLKRIHGSSSFTGRTPDGGFVKGGELQDELTRCRARLKKAIRNEDYEEAARLRDEIHRLQGRPVGGQGSPGAS